MWRKLSNDLNDKLEKKAKKNGEDYERQWYGVKKEQESTPIFFYKMIQILASSLAMVRQFSYSNERDSFECGNFATTWVTKF